MKIRILILLCAVALLSSCSDTDYVEKVYTRKLVKHTWKMNSYVDHSVNELMDISETIYEFHNDGSLTKTLDDGSQHEVTWALFDSADYLVIGDNIFKINTLTNRLLGVSYGDVDIFFVPAD